MLNLREAARSTSERQTITTPALSQITTLQIAPPDLVGDLGAPLNHGISTVWTEATTAAPEAELIHGHEGDREQEKSQAALALERRGPLTAGLLDGDDSREASFNEEVRCVFVLCRRGHSSDLTHLFLIAGAVTDIP